MTYTVAVTILFKEKKKRDAEMKPMARFAGMDPEEIVDTRPFCDGFTGNRFHAGTVHPHTVYNATQMLTVEYGMEK